MPKRQHLSTSSNTYPLRIRTCKADKGCKYGCKSGDKLKDQLNKAFHQIRFPAKIKVGISGCTRCCTSPKVRDIGLIATPEGWELHFGGNSGYTPQIALPIARGLSSEEVIKTVKQILSLYLQYAEHNQRTPQFISSFGEKKFLTALLHL